MPDQVMTDVPEYRQSKNAPSQNAIDKAYQRGIIKGIEEARDGLRLVRLSTFDIAKYLQCLLDQYTKLNQTTTTETNNV